jgi:hypothetical protein
MASKLPNLFLGTVWVALCLIGCSSQISGGGSDIDTYHGTIALAPGEKPENVEIMIFSAAYLPVDNAGFSDTVRPDSNGRFYFDSLTNGIYNLYCRDTIMQIGAFLDSIMVNGKAVPDTTPVQLDNVYTILGSGVVDSGNPLYGSVYIKGSPFICNLTNGNFTMKNIPMGQYRFSAKSFPIPGGGAPDTMIEYNGPKIIVQSDTTITTSQSDWIKQGSTIITQANWTKQMFDTTENLMSVTSGNGLFVTVSSDHNIFASSDGTAWTKRTPANGYPIESIFYANGLFIGLGNNIMITSPDAVTWTQIAVQATDKLASVAYGADRFVVAGYNDILTSPDGITWAGIKSPFYPDSSWPGSPPWIKLLSIAYGANRFVAVGRTGVVGSNDTILASFDGIAWTKQIPGTSQYLGSVTYGNGLFAAVGAFDTILTSPDGITWTKRPLGLDITLYSITYCGGQFVAVGANGVILASPDAVSWTKQTSGSTNPLYSVTYNGNGLFAAVGFSGTILTSEKATGH